MHRILVSLSAAAVFAAASAAQCGTFGPTGTFVGGGDDTLFATHYPLGFAFPMAGSAGTTTWTHLRVCTNGWAILTDGATQSGVPSSTSYGSVAAASTASLYGPAGSNPRFAPYWGDLNSTGTNGVYVDTSTPGVAKVTWLNVVDYGNAVQKSFSLELFASGQVRFAYAPGMNLNAGGTKYVGLSCSNGLAVPAASDFAPGPAASAVGAMHQTFSGAGALDLGGKVLDFVPAGAGWTENVSCAYLSASHTSYGNGCYVISDSAYQYFADAAAAAPALAGASVQFTPAGASYVMSYGGGTFLAPSALAVPVFAAATDDGETVVTPSLPMPTPQGPQASLRVHSNGLVSWGAAAQTFPGTNNWVPTPAAFLAAANAGIWFWHDYNETEVGSGRIVREEVTVGADTVLVLTWNDVENYSNPALVNRGTVQAQLNLTTGAVALVFVSVDGNTTSTFGSGHLVGYSPGGASANAGSIDLATALPLVIPTQNLNAMALAATPTPVSTPGAGTLVTYTQSDIPEAAPGSGVFLGATILSFGQDLPGTSLASLGMPGCNLHLASLDLLLTFVGAANSLPTQFQIPAGVAYGTQLFAQSVALVVPGSLPNGQNPFGATLSNGVASFISTL